MAGGYFLPFFGFLFLLPGGRPAGFTFRCAMSVSGITQYLLPKVSVSVFAFGNRPCLTQRRILEAAAPVIFETSRKSSIFTSSFFVAMIGNLSRLIPTGNYIDLKYIYQVLI